MKRQCFCSIGEVTIELELTSNNLWEYMYSNGNAVVYMGKFGYSSYV